MFGLGQGVQATAHPPRPPQIGCHLLPRSAEGRTRFYVARALVFGATASVYSFNRVSRSLWWLLNRFLRVPAGVYFDDYPLMVLRARPREQRRSGAVLWSAGGRLSADPVSSRALRDGHSEVCEPRRLAYEPGLALVPGECEGLVRGRPEEARSGVPSCGHAWHGVDSSIRRPVEKLSDHGPAGTGVEQHGWPVAAP